MLEATFLWTAQLRAEELSLRTPFPRVVWRNILAHIPDVTDDEVDAALSRWDKKTWLSFYRQLQREVSICSH